MLLEILKAQCFTACIPNFVNIILKQCTSYQKKKVRVPLMALIIVIVVQYTIILYKILKKRMSSVIFILSEFQLFCFF